MAEKSDKQETKFKFYDKTSEETRVLDPDNPLLEKFQKALKEHLLRQVERLKEDIFEYDCGIKKNNVKREELGITVYEEQQKVAKQQAIIDSSSSKLETVKAAREEIEHVLDEKKIVHKKERERLQQTEAEELELRGEVEGMNLLISQMSKWEDNLESDIAVKRRVYEKSRKEKKKLAEEKRFQDALIYKLMTRIWELERELDSIDVQLKVKEQEREELAQTAALGNTNIEAIESEYRCLMHSWNSVIIAIGNRDKVLNCLNIELKKLDEKFKTTISETEQIKKLTQKEMKRNEELTQLRERFAHDIQICKNSIDVEIQKKITYEHKMTEMQAIIDQTDADIQKILEETNESRYVLVTLEREFDQIDAQKSDLEEKILKVLENQTTSNKITMNLRRLLKIVKDKNREMQVTLASLENKNAGVNAEIEIQKYANAESQKYLTELQAQLSEQEKEADEVQERIKKMNLLIGKRQREFDMLNMKYQKLVLKSGAAVKTSPLEQRIFTLEKNIEEVQEENKKLQQFWLREQTNLIRLSEERQEQIQNNNLLRKQIMILEQKNLKVGDELEAQKKLEEKLARNILNLQNRLKILSDSFCQKNKLRLNLCKDNDVMRQDYVYKLKDAELECLKLEDEIAEIEEDKVVMSKELIDLNREVLEWEKKFLHAKETKTTMLEERSKGGEVGTMRAEIHRMQVRYSQLKKAQDVLVQDLEHCVSRRDAIITVAEAREKRVQGGAEKTRINFSRKLDDIKNKTKQMENEIEQMENKLETIATDKLQVEEEIKNVEAELGKIVFTKKELQNEVEEAKTQRQLNFELLVGLQKKLIIYTDLSKGRKPFLMYRTPSIVTAEYSKQMETNNKLMKILENLLTDFPNRAHEITRILNTLKLPIYVAFPQ